MTATITAGAPARLPAATARLAFRAWCDDDLPLARSIFGDPKITALVGGPFDAAQVAARLAAELANQRAHGIAYWPIALQARGAAPAPAPHVGCCGLKPRAARALELGFYLLPAYWGGGYAAEAARAVIAHAFAAHDIDFLFAGHHPDNHGSRRVLEKVGFAYTHHELYPPTGLMHPGYELRP